MQRFLGIDFGWECKASGLAALDWDGTSLRLAALDLALEPADVVAWVEERAGPNAVVGIDAPTVIPNATGMRPADKLMHSHYGKYHAGCYPANRQRPYWRRTTGLAARLEKLGFAHAAALVPRALGRYQIEVHPHAATVQLYGLDRIVKYKRGSLASRRAGLERLRMLMLERLPRLTPPLILDDLPPIPTTGRELKSLEDRLDSITCAYVAAHWWYWGVNRNQVHGDRRKGYIIVPNRQASLTFAELRESYLRGGLLEADVDPDPIVQFEKWFAEALAAGLKEPNAMTLATASSDGVPSARLVLLKGVDQRGFVFFTNYESGKGRELAANPRAALVFYWPELERQVRISGDVTQTSGEESDKYFQSRPTGSQLGAWASRQSEKIAGRTILEDRLADLQIQYDGKPVPRPPHWGGYRVRPRLIEFWQGRPNRLHDRLRYTRDAAGSWRLERLSP